MLLPNNVINCHPIKLIYSQRSFESFLQVYHLNLIDVKIPRVPSDPTRLKNNKKDDQFH